MKHLWLGFFVKVFTTKSTKLDLSQAAFKLTIETLEQGVKYVQNWTRCKICSKLIIKTLELSYRNQSFDLYSRLQLGLINCILIKAKLLRFFDQIFCSFFQVQNLSFKMFLALIFAKIPIFSFAVIKLLNLFILSFMFQLYIPFHFCYLFIDKFSVALVFLFCYTSNWFLGVKQKQELRVCFALINVSTKIQPEDMSYN